MEGVVVEGVVVVVAITWVDKTVVYDDVVGVASWAVLGVVSCCGVVEGATSDWMVMDVRESGRSRLVAG